jgi:hypothetical protein
MDVAAAGTALHAWQLQPRAVRREVVALSRKGLPAPDPAIAKLAVDWGRSTWPLTYGPALWCTALTVVVIESRQYARAYPGNALMDMVGSLSLVTMFAYVIVMGRRHQRAQETATVNLRGLLAIGAYTPRKVLEVRATRTPRWFIPGLLTLIVFFVAADIFGALLRSEDLGAGYAGTLCFPLVFGGAIYLIRRWRQSVTTGRRPRGGTRVLTLGPDGLEVPRLERTVAWSDVTTADVAPSNSTNALPLAIRFTLREPDQTSTSPVGLREKVRTVVFPGHWLEQDPGVILATAHHHMAASTAP